MRFSFVKHVTLAREPTAHSVQDTFYVVCMCESLVDCLLRRQNTELLFQVFHFNAPPCVYAYACVNVFVSHAKKGVVYVV